MTNAGALPPAWAGERSVTGGPEVIRHDSEELRRKMAESHARLGAVWPALGPYWLAVGVCGVLTLGAALAVGVLLAGGAEPRTKWGYLAAAVAVLVGSLQAAPVVAVLTRATRGYWAIPLRRIADLLGLAGIVSTPLCLILLYQLPDWQGRPSIWFDQLSAPQAPDAAAMTLLAVCGLALLWLSVRPDRRGWAGTPKAWAVLALALVVIGSLYVAVLVYVDMLVVADLAVSLVPGWHSSDMPVYMIFTGFEAGLAAVVVSVAAVRHFGGLEQYIPEDVFKGMSKLLLAFALLFVWFFWAEFLTYWYGRLPEERDFMRLFLFGPYLVPFAMSIFCCFLLPTAVLIWNAARSSVRATTFVALVILIGNFADRVRIFVPAWSLAGPLRPRFDMPAARVPDLWDALILLGVPAAVALLLLLGVRLVGPIALWEHHRDLLLRVQAPVLETSMPVIAKPD
jgi:hypothetical protein